MKMVMIAYNEAIEAEVMEILENYGQKNYTKIPGAFGCGAASGIHLGDDIWPGRNSILFIACEDKLAKQMLSGVKELRKTLKHEGLKAFILPLEEIS